MLASNELYEECIVIDMPQPKDEDLPSGDAEDETGRDILAAFLKSS
jgi:hypothetical protein